MLPTAAYIVRDDLIFTACHFDQDAHEDEYYAEHEEPTPEETRLLASLALAIGPDRGLMAQYPAVTSIRLSGLPALNEPETMRVVETKLRKALASFSWQPAASGPLPPSRYEHFHRPLPVDVHRNIFEKINDQDHLLIRGLATWMKSSMLYRHPAFAEEANYPLWISLDASMAIILQALRMRGVSTPTATDAQNFIHDALGEVRSELKYFAGIYNDRIKSLHPKGRFGSFAVGPIKRNEFYSVHNGLRDIYRYIILGTVIDPQVEGDGEEYCTDHNAGLDQELSRSRR